MSKSKVRSMLQLDFFNRPTLSVSQDLLGKFIVNPVALEGTKALCITEVEAYIGETDPASHARAGRTARTAPMYGSAGTIYIYKIYGLHFCCNVVTEAEGFPAAVLIRAGIVADALPEGACRLDREALKRIVADPRINCIDGPGRLCRFLEIDARFNNTSATSIHNLHFEDRGIQVSDVHSGSRIGITRGTEHAWRFFL